MPNRAAWRSNEVGTGQRSCANVIPTNMSRICFGWSTYFYSKCICYIMYVIGEMELADVCKQQVSNVWN